MKSFNYIKVGFPKLSINKRFLSKLIIPSLFWIGASFVQGQGVRDAVLLSENIPGGTSRFVSMGGSMSALGGDFSVLSTNPAGLGVFRNSQLMFTPSFYTNLTSSNYLGTKGLEEYSNKLNMSNIGYVGVYQTGQKSGLVSVSFGLGYNKQMNFNKDYYLEGVNYDHSMADAFWVEASPYWPDELRDPNYFEAFSSGLAYDAYILDLDTVTGDYFSWVPLLDGPQSNPNDHVTQYKRGSIEGKNNEWDISLGFNVSHKLYFGFTIGIQSFYYNSTSTYGEDFVDDGFYAYYNYSDPSSRASWFEYTQDYTMQGNGYNFKFGAIYRPIEMLRLGFAFHSPTFFNIDDEFSAYMKSSLLNDEYNNYIVDYNTAYPTSGYGDQALLLNEYKFKTPMRINTSIGLQFSRLGLLNIEYEYMDYSRSKFSGGSNATSMQDLNSDLKDELTVSHRLRVGGEIRLDMFAIRQGFAYYTSPYSNMNINEGLNSMYYTGGVGLVGKNIFFDIAYMYGLQEESEVLYNYGLTYNDQTDTYYDNRPIADFSSRIIKLMATVGFKF